MYKNMYIYINWIMFLAGHVAGNKSGLRIARKLAKDHNKCYVKIYVIQNQCYMKN
jgi:hypothetical protein